jgi:hypothetical protein
LSHVNEGIRVVFEDAQRNWGRWAAISTDEVLKSGIIINFSFFNY